MADDEADTTTGSSDQQPASESDDSKPEGKKDDGKTEGKGKDEKRPDNKKDDEQERKAQFAEAAGDPLADALGGASARAGESQAYRTWIRTVRASGGAAFVGGGNIGVLNITTTAGGVDRGGQAPGPVATEVLTALINRYVPPAGYEKFFTKLVSTRLLVLRGAPGTGRTTTGLRLLAKVADGVARFGPDTDLRTLAAVDLEPRCGYLYELAPGSVTRHRPWSIGCVVTWPNATAIWSSLPSTTSATATVSMATSPIARCPTRENSSSGPWSMR